MVLDRHRGESSESVLVLSEVKLREREREKNNMGSGP